MSSLQVARMRKAELSLRIANQRLGLASQVNDLSPLFRKADAGLRAANAVAAAWPWLGVLGAIGAARLFRKSPPPKTVSHAPATALLWLRRGLLAWRAWSWARNTLSPRHGAPSLLGAMRKPGRR